MFRNWSLVLLVLAGITPALGAFSVEVLNPSADQALVYGLVEGEQPFPASNFDLELINSTGGSVILDSFGYWSHDSYDSVVSDGLLLATFNTNTYGNGTFITKFLNGSELLDLKQLFVETVMSVGACQITDVVVDEDLKGVINLQSSINTSDAFIFFRTINKKGLSQEYKYPVEFDTPGNLVKFFAIPSSQLRFEQGANLLVARLVVEGNHSPVCYYQHTIPAQSTIFEGRVEMGEYRLWESEGGNVPLTVFNTGYPSHLTLKVSGEIIDEGGAYFSGGGSVKTITLSEQDVELVVEETVPGLYPVTLELFRNGELLFTLEHDLFVRANRSVEVSGLQSYYDFIDGMKTRTLTITNHGKESVILLELVDENGEEISYASIPESETEMLYEVDESRQIHLNMDLSSITNKSVIAVLRVSVQGEVVTTEQFSLNRKSYTSIINIPSKIFLDGVKEAETSFLLTNTGDPAEFALTLSGELFAQGNASLSPNSFNLGSDESIIVKLKTNLTSEPEHNELVMKAYANGEISDSAVFKVFLYGSPEMIASVSDSYTVRRGRSETITLFLKNLGKSSDYSFELSDSVGELAVFDHASLSYDKKFFEKDERAYYNISVRVPEDYADESAEMTLSVLFSEEVVKEIPISLEIIDRGLIHWLMIEDYSFNKKYYLAGDVGMVSFEVVNRGDFSETVQSSISFSGRTVKSSTTTLLSPGKSFTVRLPFKVSESIMNSEIALTAYTNDLEETESAEIPVIVPNHDFAVGSSNATIIVDDGQEFSLKFVLSNLGNVPDTYRVILEGYPAETEDSFITVQPGSATVVFAEAVSDFEKLAFQDVITFKVCLIDSSQCRSASSKIVPRTVKPEEGELKFVAGATSEKVGSLGSAVYSITVQNDFDLPRKADFNIISGSEVNASLHPASLTVPPGLVEHVYVYAIALQGTGPGVYDLTLQAFDDGKKVFEQGLKFEVVKESFLATTLAFIKSQPLTYLIPLALVVGVLLFLYLRYRFGGEGSYYEYENYY